MPVHSAHQRANGIVELLNIVPELPAPAAPPVGAVGEEGRVDVEPRHKEEPWPTGALLVRDKVLKWGGRCSGRASEERVSAWGERANTFGDYGIGGETEAKAAGVPGT